MWVDSIEALHILRDIWRDSYRKEDSCKNEDKILRYPCQMKLSINYTIESNMKIKWIDMYSFVLRIYFNESYYFSH